MPVRAIYAVPTGAVRSVKTVKKLQLEPWILESFRKTSFEAPSFLSVTCHKLILFTKATAQIWELTHSFICQIPSTVISG